MDCHVFLETSQTCEIYIHSFYCDVYITIVHFSTHTVLLSKKLWTCLVVSILKAYSISSVWIDRGGIDPDMSGSSSLYTT